jgi:hypothetical protein
MRKKGGANENDWHLLWQIFWIDANAELRRPLDEVHRAMEVRQDTVSTIPLFIWEKRLLEAGIPTEASNKKDRNIASPWCLPRRSHGFSGGLSLLVSVRRSLLDDAALRLPYPTVPPPTDGTPPITPTPSPSWPMVPSKRLSLLCGACRYA